MEIISTKDAAEKLNVTPRTIMSLCAKGIIKDAYKEGKSWKIPATSVDDYIKTMSLSVTMLPCPVGSTSYMEISQKCYYVDKTLLIKNILDEANKVILFARPRRFGKTLTMDMLKTFFEKSEVDTSVYFQNRKIWKMGKRYTEHQGKYPVIFLSFKDLKLNSWASTFSSFKLIIKYEYKRHEELLRSEKLDQDEKDLFQRTIEQKLSYEEYLRSIKFLSDILFKQYNKKVIIIIDEYDTPIQQGHTKGFYDETIDFLKNLFSLALKDNASLEYGFLTGILRISKENLFSDLNNITVNTVLDTKFSECFGFTASEVEAMTKYYGLENKLEEIREWYDGYRFGNNEIYNPWSVTSYFSNNCEANPYWANTSTNEIIKEVLVNTKPSVIKDLKELLQGKKIIVKIDTRIIYPNIKSNKDAIYTFLLLTGYLKITGKIQDDFYSVALPNKEILNIYQQEVLNWISAENTDFISNNICKAIIANDTELLNTSINDFLKTSASFLDTASESFYHGLILAFCAAAAKNYTINSNREAGYGRFDIEMRPNHKEEPAIIMEFKVADDKNKLMIKAKEAIKQICSKEYYIELKKQGYSNIIGYGIAFCGKDIETISQKL